MPINARRTLSAILLLGIFAAVGMLGTGRAGYVSTSGTSMLPTYESGDLALIARSNSYRVGQNIAYRDPGSGVVVLHRIVDGDADGFVTQGDNNASIDPHTPSTEEVIGRVVLHVPRVGGVAASPLIKGGVIVVLLALIGALVMIPAPARTAEDAVRPARRPVRTVWFLLLGVTTLLAVATASAFVLAPEESSGASMTAPSEEFVGVLTYTADAPTGDTYPGGRADSGDTLFRDLVEELDVQLDFGSIDVDPDRPLSNPTGIGRLHIELAGPMGWSVPLPVSDESVLDDGALTVATTVRLDDLAERAQRVADETGVPMSPVTVRIVAVVEMEVDGEQVEPFEASMSFQLTDHALMPSPSTPFEDDGEGVSVDHLLALDPVESETSASGIPSGVRNGLLIALLAAIAATAAVWPERSGARSPLRLSARGVTVSDTLCSIELVDRDELAEVAASFGCPVMVNKNGAECVATAVGVYWVAPDEPSAPGPHDDPSNH